MVSSRMSVGASLRRHAFVSLGRIVSVVAILGLTASLQAHAQVSCTGLCLEQVSCAPGVSTTITGTVYAPNGTDPLPNVLVYIPNAAVQPFTPGISCSPNGIPASGSPLVSTTTAVDGTFTLTNVPVGTNIPLVIQAGKWRRQFTIPVTNSCSNTAASTAVPATAGTDTTTVPAGHVLHLPQNQAEGDIPLIAISTGNLDGVECVLSKMGVSQSEFTNPSGGGRIQFYFGAAVPGAKINSSTPSETALEGNSSVLDQYDLVLLACQGQQYAPAAQSLANIHAYANAGGRIYATHYSYDFLYNNNDFSTVADWKVNQTPYPADQTATINQSFPDGSEFANWLEVLDPALTLGSIPVTTIRKDQDGINPATSQAYLSIADPSEVIQFTFSTPVTAAPANQCGRVLYNEYHVENSTGNDGKIFPNECPTGAITPQEQFLEYSLFDLGTSVTPTSNPTVAVSFTNTPTTLTPGDPADTAAITVTNTSTTTATNATLTLAVSVPSGLTITSLAPAIPATSGWTCSVATKTCTRTTGLNAQASDTVILTFAVAASASSPQTLSATVSNGNLAAPVTATDPLVIPLTLSPPSEPLPNASYGVAYSQQFTAGGGDAPYTYGISGTPPPGLSINSATGLLSGVPTASADGNTYNFNVVVTDSASNTVSQQYSIAVPQVLASSTLTVSSASFPTPNSAITALAGTSVSATFTLIDTAGLPIAVPAGTNILSTAPSSTAVFGTPVIANGILTETITDTAPETLDLSAYNQGTLISPATASVTFVVSSYNAGTVPVAQQSSILTADLYFPNGGTLGSLNFLTQGAPNLDFIGCTTGPSGKQPAPGKGSAPRPTSFTCPSSKSKDGTGIPVCSLNTVYTAGQVCSVSYIFQPSYPGQRLGSVAAVNSNGNPMGTSYLNGLGTGPQVVFPGNTTNNVLGAGNYYTPYSVAVDSVGNVYVADTYNGAVKEVMAVGGSVPANPTVRTLVNGLSGPFGVAVDGAGNVFFSDSDSNTVREIVAVGGTIPASPTVLTLSNTFSQPEGVAVDAAGNVYVADLYNKAVKVMVAAGGSIPANPTILSLGSGWVNPEGVAVDSSGDVYVADTASASVKELLATGGSFPTSGPTQTLGSGFYFPKGVAVDGSGNVYVTDASSAPVKEIVAVGGTIPANPTILTLGSGFSLPLGVAVDGAGNVYVADPSLQTISEIPLATPPSVTFADTNVGSASSSNPQKVTVANDGYDPTNTNPLTFSGVSTGTANFGLDATNACSTSTSLEPGQACVLAADFMPQVSGTPLTDAVTLADNNLNNIGSTSSPQLVPLSGNGLQQTPGVVVAPATVTYGTATVALTAAISFTGTVAPTGTVKFTIDSGLPVVASCSGTTSPLFCTANYPSNTLQVVATHTITASIAATPGFLMASGTNTLTVSQATLTVGIIGNPTKAYDGTTTASLASANYQVGNLVGSDSITVTQPIGTYAAATAGPEGVTAALTSANYTATTGYLSNYVLPTTATGPGIITQATSVTTVICSPTSVTYNGAAQTPCTASVMGAGSLNQSLILTYSSNVNAGVNTASATATYSGDNNHAGSTGSATFTILPAPVTAQAGVGNAVYDGNTHSPSACAVTGAYTGNLTCTNSPASVGPDVINTTIIPVVSGSNLSNFAIMKVNGNFTINQSPSVTTVICSPSSVPYTGAPQTPCTATVTGVNLNQSVTVSYSSNVSAGVNTASATATYAGDTDHSGSTGSKTFTITQATPVVSWPNPPSIVYGTGTGPAQKNATATGVGGVSLSGSYFYTTSDGTIFTVGTHPLGVAFTPTDTTDYVPVSAYAYLTVTKATPVVTWTPPAAITYGTALSATQLNANSSVPGSYSYSPIAGTVLHAGGQTLSVTFTPNDTTDYNPVTTTVPLTVNKATPVITWQTPASITYGTPISATQLDATANVPGTFLYTASTGPNPLGVLLPPGTTALSATLTPTDATDYNSVTAYVVFTVSKAQTTTTLAVTTTQTVTGTTATLTATVKPQIGGTPTGTVTYYNGSAILGSAAVGTPFTTGVLPVGTDQITAVYGGDTNFVGSSSSASAVVSIAPTTVQLIEPLGTVFYPASAVGFTVIVPLKNLQLISGTITLYDGSTVIGTYSLPIGGILAGITPPLSRGTHSLRAVYGGNAQYPPGQSPIITVTVQ